MQADRILLVNHQKAGTWELAIQIIEHFGDGRPTCFNVIMLIRLGQQWAWNVDFHIAPDKG